MFQKNQEITKTITYRFKILWYNHDNNEKVKLVLASLGKMYMFWKSNLLPNL